MVALKAEMRAHAAAMRLVERELRSLKKRKMKQGGGRRKGSANENVVAKQIVAAFAEFGIKQKDCYRTPSSGGHRFAKKEDPSDLVISKKLAKIFPFAVECKHYKDIDLHPFWLPSKLWKKSWQPKKWLEQVYAQSSLSRPPMLVMRMNGKPAMAAMPILQVTMRTPYLVFRPWRDTGKPYHGEWLLVRFSRVLGTIADEERDKRNASTKRV